jgi:hypothetical protein
VAATKGLTGKRRRRRQPARQSTTIRLRDAGHQSGSQSSWTCDGLLGFEEVNPPGRNPSGRPLRLVHRTQLTNAKGTAIVPGCAFAATRYRTIEQKLQFKRHREMPRPGPAPRCSVPVVAWAAIYHPAAADSSDWPRKRSLQTLTHRKELGAASIGLRPSLSGQSTGGFGGWDWPDLEEILGAGP